MTGVGPVSRVDAVGGSLPVLMYHSVPAGGEGNPLAVPRARVDEQWAALRGAGWELRDLTGALAAKTADPGRRIVGLTFDDGLDDFENVPDLLSRYDATATLYVPTAHVGGSGEALGGYPGRVLDWDRLAALPDDLVEVGSHAHQHVPVDVLPRAELAAALATSRTLLEDHLGRPARSFCYPHGYAARGTARLVAAAGFDNGCIVGRRIAGPDDDRYRIPRLQALPEHDAAGILALVETGEPGWAATLKRIAHPAWRLVRWTAYRSTGRVLS